MRIHKSIQVADYQTACELAGGMSQRGALNVRIESLPALNLFVVHWEQEVKE